MVDYAFGGAGRDRTAVHDAFTTKELQQFFTSFCYALGTHVPLLFVHTVLYPLALEKTTRTFANLQ
jgi:hypothetical protein